MKKLRAFILLCIYCGLITAGAFFYSFMSDKIKVKFQSPKVENAICSTSSKFLLDKRPFRYICD
jgi:hypothetical protein